MKWDSLRACVAIAVRGAYRVPVRAWRLRLAVATVIHSTAPRIRGRAPALRSATMLVDRPIADSATETRNTDACSRGECAAAGIIPQELTAATRTKPIRNQGTSLAARRGDMRADARAGAPAAAPSRAAAAGAVAMTGRCCLRAVSAARPRQIGMI